MTYGSPQPPQIELSSRGPSIADAYYPLLALGRVLKRATNLPPPERIRERLEEALRQADARAREVGRAEHIDAARFAIVAFLDEMILTNKQYEHRLQFLESSLQNMHYRTNTAGNQFFDRLDDLRRQISVNLPAIQVYQECLAAGFAGKLMNASERENYIAGLSRQLATGAEVLSEIAPHATRRDIVVSKSRSLPRWLPIVVAVVVALVAILVVRSLSEDRARRASTAVSDASWHGTGVHGKTWGTA